MSSDAGIGSTAHYRPGTLERLATGLVFFIMAYNLPDRWFVPSDAEDASLALTRITLALLVGGLFLIVLPYADSVRRVLGLDARLHMFMVLVVFSFFWSADRTTTVRIGGELLIATVFSIYVFMRYRMREWLELAAWSASIGAVVNLAFVFGLPALGLEQGNWTGVLFNKNLLALQTLFDFIVLLSAASVNPRRRAIFRTAAVVAFITLVGSQGKTALVAWIVTVCATPIYIGFRGRSSLPGAVGLAFAATSIFVTAFATANLGLITELLGKDITLTGRTEIWRLLVDVFWSKPFIGHGWGATFGGYFSPVHDIWVATSWEPLHAHNSLYQVLLDLGLLGGVLFVALYFRAVRRSVVFVQTIPGAMGLFPLLLLTASFAISLAETGIISLPMRWLFFSLAVLSVGAVKEPLEQPASAAPTTERVPAAVR